jgi:hypothetical protein
MHIMSMFSAKSAAIRAGKHIHTHTLTFIIVAVKLYRLLMLSNVSSGPFDD